MRGKSFQIALAAVSCALATIFMSLGINVPAFLLVGYVFGSLALMLPLAKDFRLGGFLAYAAVCLLCLLFGGIVKFYLLFPFLTFFGLHPLANYFQRKYKINRWVAFAVKAAWFDAMLCCTVLLLFKMSTEFSLPYEWMYDWIYLIAVVGGTALFFLYDWVMLRCQKTVDFYVAKIERGGARGNPEQTQGKDETPRGDVFGGYGDDENEARGDDPPAQEGNENGGENEEKDKNEGNGTQKNGKSD